MFSKRITRIRKEARDSGQRLNPVKYRLLVGIAKCGMCARKLKTADNSEDYTK